MELADPLSTDLTESLVVSDPDRDAMYRHFEAHPGDLAGYGAMADKLDEIGYPKLAHAFRWMSHRGVWPHKRKFYTRGVSPGRKVPAKFGWAWYSKHGNENSTLDTVNTRSVGPRSLHKNHALASLVMVGDQKVFASHQQAVMWLAGQLDRLQRDYSVYPPKKSGL